MNGDNPGPNNALLTFLIPPPTFFRPPIAKFTAESVTGFLIVNPDCL